MEDFKNKEKEQSEQNAPSDPFHFDEKGTTFGGRLKKLIGNKSGRSFAKEVNISYSTIHNYLTDVSQPTLDNLITLAEHTGAELEWLARGRSSGLSGKHSVNENGIEYSLSDDDYVQIDDFRNIKISAGFGAENGDHYKTNFAKVERAWLQARRLKAADCAMFRVNGDSMEPTLKNDEEIIIDRSKSCLEEGKIFVINHGGTIWVKKVQITFDGVELISDNTEYKPISLNQDEADNLIVIGQVVRGYRNF
ncbi:repressor [Chelonobacter oris]|uniref:LexA family transcriptional regulator n=1 Tax=Chelonobacter oris TaxID=505317 RepID=UPI002447D3DF|nr:XRE family transcriptional regulator [Chelonobacter oris]MDH2999653.1 repressor [Chelonobacter oris]